MRILASVLTLSLLSISAGRADDNAGNGGSNLAPTFSSCGEETSETFIASCGDICGESSCLHSTFSSEQVPLSSFCFCGKEPQPETKYACSATTANETLEDDCDFTCDNIFTSSSDSFTSLFCAPRVGGPEFCVCIPYEEDLDDLAAEESTDEGDDEMESDDRDKRKNEKKKRCKRIKGGSKGNGKKKNCRNKKKKPANSNQGNGAPGASAPVNQPGTGVNGGSGNTGNIVNVGGLNGGCQSQKCPSSTNNRPVVCTNVCGPQNNDGSTAAVGGNTVNAPNSSANVGLAPGTADNNGVVYAPIF